MNTPEENPVFEKGKAYYHVGLLFIPKKGEFLNYIVNKYSFQEINQHLFYCWDNHFALSLDFQFNSPDKEKEFYYSLVILLNLSVKPDFDVNNLKTICDSYFDGEPHREFKGNLSEDENIDLADEFYNYFVKEEKSLGEEIEWLEKNNLTHYLYYDYMVLAKQLEDYDNGQE